ncbi:ImmA/IrrE family metallo-endopeptidase [Cohnella thailandensis]|uniref:ImmA/IrrE family metallo-endopeptidase n=1 Tax=Cohnella thailandensis TaxID=557557 RepID=A0A841ST45_9BACL|nr:ImmA/IrrE family metallo-endopeptidase [Cohnella thailandensis]MBB6632797.1 ImmA/IrrE family metallo-endopeptidase [Cohnella thailandensis]MBP1975511.1 Zn-dependent peptidase ImmA (M78 family) [Cohnella thailandensis]
MDKIIQKFVRRYKTNNPFVIAEGLNINIRYADLGDNIKGLYFRKLRRRFIVVHEDLSEEWQRFVCAHELGHDRLHPGLNRFWLDDHSLFNVGKFERQANKFAVRLLTSGDSPSRGESIVEMLRRNNVPEEMSRFYF